MPFGEHEPIVGAPPAPATPPPAPVAQHESSGVNLTPAEYKKVLDDRALLQKLSAEQKTSADRAESEKLRLMAEKGQYEEAIREQKTRFDAEQAKIVAERDRIQGRYLDRERSLAVNDATAGVEFLTDYAAKQCRQILESRFEVLPGDDGSVQVVDRATRRSAAEVAREWLNGPEAAHFLKPKGKGGSPALHGNTQADGGGPTEPDDANLTYEQRVMRNYDQGRKQQMNVGWQMGVVQQSKARKAFGT